MPENLPLSFLQRIQKQFGDSSYGFIEALSNTPFVSLRLNPLKPAKTDWDEAEIVPWCTSGRYLSHKPVFTLDPLFHAGCYYPQEASSMIIDWLLRYVCSLPGQPKLLDLCGAPGGKSTLLASYLNGSGLLVANEVIKSRAAVLAENIKKWGAANCIVTQNDPKVFGSLNAFFDLILVDAPCSGEGMFRKDQRSVDEWSENNAAMCALRQQRILSDIWPALRDNGYLIYSTCTFNPTENEENVTWFAETYNAEVLSVKVPDGWGVQSIPIGAGNGLAFYPHLVRGEGFFVAVLKKIPSGQISPSQKKTNKTRLKVPAGLEKLLTTSQTWVFQEERTGWHAFPESFSDELNLFKQKLNLIWYGTQLGQIVKNNLVPAHELAVSTALHSPFFPKVDLPKQESLRFLKGETITPPSECERGYVLITYKGVPLGFAKNIGNRMNNLYPSGWRIRMSLP